MAFDNADDFFFLGFLLWFDFFSLASLTCYFKRTFLINYFLLGKTNYSSLSSSFLYNKSKYPHRKRHLNVSQAISNSVCSKLNSYFSNQPASPDLCLLLVKDIVFLIIQVRNLGLTLTNSFTHSPLFTHSLNPSAYTSYMSYEIFSSPFQLPLP